MTDLPLVSVIILSYNSREDLEDALPSILNQSLPDDQYEVIVVDNDSSDGSSEIVEHQFPDVRLVENDTNRWYAGGNNDGLDTARGEYLAVLNPDVLVDHEWLETLIKPLRSSKSNIGMTTSKIIRNDERDRLNTCGGHDHFTGLSFTRGKNKHPSNFNTKEIVSGASGCSLAFSREVYEEIGGFDEMMEFYHEDVDLSWRVGFAGYDILYVPESIVYHKYDRDLPDWRFFNFERNRILLLLKYLRPRTMVMILPALLLTEIGMIGMSLYLGPSHFMSKLQVWPWLWNHREQILEKREQTQALRNRSDPLFLSQFETTIPLDQFGIGIHIHTLINLLLATVYIPCYLIATRGRE